MTQDEYLSHDATALAERVRSGDTTPDELLDLALVRIRTFNPKLNAVVHLMEEDARRAAEASARAVRDGTAAALPFAGVPFLAKDLQTTYAGHPTSCGSRFLAETPAPKDSELAARVRASGVSVLGKTNTPEFGLLPVTEPRYWGPCRNPWDTRRTPGGSSGGSGAAIAAGIVPMAGGGDGGGSIRIPSSCCGLFGLKPTRGRTPTAPRGLLWRGASVEHVLSRSVRDSAAMLDATAGPDVGAPFEIQAPERPYVDEIAVDPGRLRIGWTTTPCVPTDVHPDCVAAVHDTMRLLEELGHELVPVEIPVDGRLFAHRFLTVVSAELGADIDEAAAFVGRRPRRNELEPSSLALALLSNALSAKQYATALRGLEAMGRDLGAFFEGYDLLLTPTLASPPPPLGSQDPPPMEETLLKILGAFGSGRVVKAAGLIDQAAKTALDFIPFTPIFNATGHPAMSVPLTWNEAGLPVGSHFVAHLGREDVLFRLAGQLERARPWFDRLPEMARTPL